jgi:hypothetical protein
MDGYNTVTFCKVCSAEGLGLVENCQGYTPLPCVADGLPLSECKAIECRKHNRCCWKNPLDRKLQRY